MIGSKMVAPSADIRQAHFRATIFSPYLNVLQQAVCSCIKTITSTWTLNKSVRPSVSVLEKHANHVAHPKHAAKCSQTLTHATDVKYSSSFPRDRHDISPNIYPTQVSNVNCRSVVQIASRCQLLLTQPTTMMLKPGSNASNR